MANLPQPTPMNNAGVLGGASKFFPIVPGAAEITTRHRAVYVGTGGDLVVLGWNEEDDTALTTFKNVPSGQTLDISVRKILATGSAADIVGIV